MNSIHSYEGWWDLSLMDDRNERALLSGLSRSLRSGRRRSCSRSSEHPRLFGKFGDA